MPILTVFAGINGAGKTTLYKYEKKFVGVDLGERVNPDEIFAQQSKKWNPSSVIQSGRIAINKIKYCIANKLSFNWETTSLGRIGEKFITEAKAHGFEVHLNFVGMDDVEESLRRIDNRVACGGHGVPEEIVRSRHQYQSKGLAKALPLVDKAILFDNSETISVVGSFFEKKLYVFDGSSKWMQELVSLIDPNTPDDMNNI